MDEHQAWRSLSGDDEKLAERAFAVLQKRYLPALHGYMHNAGMRNYADCDDLISAGFLKLWVARKRIHCPNESAGRSYLFTIVGRCMIDNVRAYAKAPTVPMDFLVGTDEELTAPDSPEGQVHARMMTEYLMAAANCLWLGLDSSLLPTTHTRQLLASQLYYLESCTLEEIIQILQPNSPSDEPKLTFPVLEEWIRHPGVIRFLAYEQLCYESTRLLTFVLGLREVNPDLISNLWQVARSSPPDEPALHELTWAAVAVAIMRYQHAVSYDEVAGARHEVVQSWGYSQPKILTLLELLRRRLPFCRETELLLELLGYRTQIEESKHSAEILGIANLWQRLSFQYSYMMDLAQKDILERVQPPASTAGYTLTEHTLNSWISGKRLQKQLLRYWKELYGDQDND